MRVLGVDTSLRSTGVGIVEAVGTRMTAIEHGAIRIPASRPHSECLRSLHCGITELLERLPPQAVAVEGGFFHRNAKTAMVLGEARGVVIAAGACAGIPVYEYAPKRVKQAVVGNGAASKLQVRRMIMTILGLDEEPQEDAGDALAIAVCHLHNRSGCEALAPKEI